MTGYTLLVNILGREFEEAYLEYYKKNGVDTVFSTLCSGTASKSMLDYLGLEKNEKVMLSTMVTQDKAESLMSGLITKMGINLPGTGIAMTVSVESIGGKASLMYLADGQGIISDEVKKVNENLYSLITVICEKGYSDTVMDYARAAGAGGGTVVHGKGTANEFTAKFFGVSIATEKEMIYIVTRRSDKDAIMKSIVENAGATTDARAAVFSLPVDDVAGLCSVTDKVSE